MRAATRDGSRNHRCDRIRQQLPLRTDSNPRRSDTIGAGPRDVRPARHRLFEGYPPGRTKTSLGRPSRPQGIDRTTPSRNACISGRRLAVSATDGVRKNTTRGRRSTERLRRRLPGDPPRTRSLRRWKHRRVRREREADLRGRFLQPTRNRRIPEVTRAASAQDPERHGARLTDHERSCKDGTDATATVCRRGATVAQGAIEARRSARIDRKATSKGNKAQGG